MSERVGTRVWPGWVFCGDGVGSARASVSRSKVTDASGPPQIWAEFGGCRTTRSFRAGLRGVVGSGFRDRSLTESSARTYRGV